MAIAATTRKKNSGILRYTFGELVTGTGARPAQRAKLAGSGGAITGAIIVRCLGADATVDPDSDDQVFGEFPGHEAISGASGTLFSGSTELVRNGIQVAQIAINPITGDFIVPTGGRFPSYIPARDAQPGQAFGQPGGTKVYAWFQASEIFSGASTVPAESPSVVVQTEVTTGRFVRGGVPETTGPVYLASIRVAVLNMGHATSTAAGVLFVELQHSEHDIMGQLDQDQTFTTIVPE